MADEEQLTEDQRQEMIKHLGNTRDRLILALWGTMHQLSNYYTDNPEEMSDEDYAIWHAVLKHSTVQTLLDKSMSKGEHT